MPFSKKVKEEVFKKCKRHCCKCEKYCGINIEVHHIIPEANGGENTVENAIPLCFDCHSEIGSYNPKHPKGNKYSEDEIKDIRNAFYEKAKGLKHSGKNLTEYDKELFKEFDLDITAKLEYIIETDFSSEYVDINLGDDFNEIIKKWSKKKYKFEDRNLENLKGDIFLKWRELQVYLSEEYLRNDSIEAGRKLHKELRPNTLKIRGAIQKLYKAIRCYD